jgi:hypothetical protein
MRSNYNEKLDHLNRKTNNQNTKETIAKETIEEILKNLIILLENIGLINVENLAEKLGIITPTRIIPVYYKHRLNYKKIAQDLLEGIDVLLPISKKNAYHLRRRLKQMIKKEIFTNIVYVSGNKYYLFSLKKPEEKYSTYYEFTKKG